MSRDDHESRLAGLRSLKQRLLQCEKDAQELKALAVETDINCAIHEANNEIEAEEAVLKS